MAVRGRKPKDDAIRRNRVAAVHDWVEVADLPYAGPVPAELPATRMVPGPDGPIEQPVSPRTRVWWQSLVAMPHCAMWTDTDWQFALTTALVADDLFRGRTSVAAELRQRERTLGTTVDARRDLRIRYLPLDAWTARHAPADATPTDAPDPDAVRARQAARRARLTDGAA